MIAFFLYYRVVRLGIEVSTMLYLVKDNGSIKDIGPEHYVVLPCGKLDPEGDGFVNVLLNEEVDPERVLSLIQSADEE